MQHQGPYSLLLIFFLTYEWAQKARTLHYTKIKRLPSDKHSSLFRAFISYEEIEVLGDTVTGAICTTLIYLLTCEWAKKLEDYITLG
jgi:hypothetical protein